jgi:hypothetical protein
MMFRCDRSRATRMVQRSWASPLLLRATLPGMKCPVLQRYYRQASAGIASDYDH